MKNLAAILLLFALTACSKNDLGKEKPELPPNEVITLPVVFHILHGGSPAGTGSNIAASKIYALINSLNKDFRGDTYGGQNAYIQFRPATKNEAGETLAEPGVNRVNTGVQKFDFDAVHDDDKWKRELIWNPDAYINIFLIDCYKGEYAGFATLPFASTSHPVEGLIKTSNGSWASNSFIQGIYLRTDILLAIDTQYHNSFSHEMGHYLGLNHVFDLKTCVADGDYCPDTHDYNRSVTPTTYDRYSCKGVSFTAVNYMDYFPVVPTQFTPNQIQRMRYVSNYSPWRAGLASSNARILPGMNDNTSPIPPPVIID